MPLPSSWGHWLKELQGFQGSFQQDLAELERTLTRPGERVAGLRLLQQLTDHACASLSHLQVLAVLVAADAGSRENSNSQL